MQTAIEPLPTPPPPSPILLLSRSQRRQRFPAVDQEILIVGSLIEVHEDGLGAVSVVQVDIDDDCAVLVVREVS